MTQQIVENAGAKPWDILPNEDVAWFKRFEKYRIMQPEDRNLKVVYYSERERRKRLGTLQGLPAYRTFLQMAKQYDWPGRSREYDKTVIEKDRAALEQIREEEARTAEEERALQRQRRREVMNLLYDKILAAIKSKNFDLTTAKPGELLQFTRVYLQQSREEYDVAPSKVAKYQYNTLTEQELYDELKERIARLSAPA